jgi:hypothetical protein
MTVSLCVCVCSCIAPCTCLEHAAAGVGQHQQYNTLPVKLTQATQFIQLNRQLTEATAAWPMSMAPCQRDYAQTEYCKISLNHVSGLRDWHGGFSFKQFQNYLHV